MAVAAIVRVVTAEADDVDLEAVLAERSRLVGQGIPAPEMRTVIARDVHGRATGEKVGPLEEEVEAVRVVLGGALGLSYVVDVVDDVPHLTGVRTEDDEHKVVDLFFVLVVLVDKVSED